MLNVCEQQHGHEQTDNESYKLKINRPIGARCHRHFESLPPRHPRRSLFERSFQYLHKCFANCRDYVGKFPLRLQRLSSAHPSMGYIYFIIQFSFCIYHSTSLAIAVAYINDKRFLLDL